jgi:hypothetical protein
MRARRIIAGAVAIGCETGQTMIDLGLVEPKLK